MQSFLHEYFNQLHFPNESFPYFNELFFSSSTTNSRQLTKTTDTCHTTLLFFLLTKRLTAPEVLSSHAKIWVYAVGERALIIKKPLPWFTLYKKEHDNRANPIVTFCPTKKPTDPKYLPVLIDSSFLSKRKSPMDLATYWGLMISRFYHNEWQNFWKRMENK